MKLAKKYPVLGSSANSENISLTIKSFGVAVIPGIILVASMMGLQLEQNELVEVVNTIATIVAGAMFLYGFGRKIYFWFADKF